MAMPAIAPMETLFELLESDELRVDPELSVLPVFEGEELAGGVVVAAEVSGLGFVWDVVVWAKVDTAT